MDLHLLRPSLVSSARCAALALAGVALSALPALADGHSDGNVAKTMESARGQLPARASKISARMSAQAQLFVEQKEAPTASKTSLRLELTPRLSAKLKD